MQFLLDRLNHIFMVARGYKLKAGAKQPGGQEEMRLRGVAIREKDRLWAFAGCDGVAELEESGDVFVDRDVKRFHEGPPVMSLANGDSQFNAGRAPRLFQESPCGA